MELRSFPVIVATLAVALTACSGSSDSTPAAGGSAGASAAGSSGAGGMCEPMPAGKVQLPADDGVHTDPIEWWYWTGHVHDSSDAWYGFEWSIIYLPPSASGGAVQSAHFAVTDTHRGEFHFREAHSFTQPLNMAGAFNFAIDTIRASGSDGSDTLLSTVDDYQVELDLQSLKSPVLQYGTGYVDYPFGGNTYYYSRERMKAAGTIRRGTEAMTVEGTGWFDHQWGQMAVSSSVKGWDWLAIQLDDGRELMLFQLRGTAGEQVFGGGSSTDAACHTEGLHQGDFSLSQGRTWKSPANAACEYPVEWNVDVQGMKLHVKAVLDDQELRLASGPYWEGAAVVTGDAEGRAYLEMTGRCP